MSDIKICLLGIKQEALVAVPFGLEWHVAVNGDWSNTTVETELPFLSPNDLVPSGFSPWTVKLVENIHEPVYHQPLSPYGSPHPDTIIDYFSWDGQFYRAKVNFYYSGGPSFTFDHSLIKAYPLRPVPPNAICQPG